MNKQQDAEMHPLEGPIDKATGLQVIASIEAHDEQTAGCRDASPGRTY